MQVAASMYRTSRTCYSPRAWDPLRSTRSRHCSLPNAKKQTHSDWDAAAAAWDPLEAPGADIAHFLTNTKGKFVMSIDIRWANFSTNFSMAIDNKKSIRKWKSLQFTAICSNECRFQQSQLQQIWKKKLFWTTYGKIAYILWCEPIAAMNSFYE